MLRTVLASLLTLSLAMAQARADEPPGDEPMPKQPAGEPAPSTPPAAAPAPAAQEAPPAAAAPAAPAAPAPAASSNTLATDEEVIANPPKVYALGFGGAALGALAIGTILGGIALSRSHEQEGNTSMPPLYTHDLNNRASQGSSLATSSYVFFAAGAALAVTDIVLWYETYRKPRVMKRTSEGGSK
jgi:hypothetical protein